MVLQDVCHTDLEVITSTAAELQQHLDRHPVSLPVPWSPKHPGGLEGKVQCCTNWGTGNMCVREQRSISKYTPLCKVSTESRTPHLLRVLSPSLSVLSLLLHPYSFSPLLFPLPLLPLLLSPSPSPLPPIPSPSSPVSSQPINASIVVLSSFVFTSGPVVSHQTHR